MHGEWPLVQRMLRDLEGRWLEKGEQVYGGRGMWAKLLGMQRMGRYFHVPCEHSPKEGLSREGLYKLSGAGLMAYSHNSHNPSTWDVEAVGSGVQG